MTSVTCNKFTGKHHPIVREVGFARTLVAETLVLAKTHGYVEKIEDELEQELARDIRPPPAERITRLRLEGDKIFKSKYMLLIVVILCILDCALVLGELTLDLHKVKVKLEDTELFISSTEHFADSMKHKHVQLHNLTPYSIFQRILKASIDWNTTNEQITVQNLSCVQTNHTRRPAPSSFADDVLMLKVDKVESKEHKEDLELFGTIAHAFHYCSITILGVLLIETLLKAVCAGRSFFHRKLEVFDACIVALSFLVDFCFIVFLPDIDTKDFVFILAILLPWRVIRVVNSLVVSVKDHEHFRLKLVYKRKKKIQSTLRETEAQVQKYRMQVTCLQRLCIMEGIDEWKVDHSLRNDGSIPPTPVKKKFKLRFDDTPFSHSGHHRAPRFSLPSLDFHGTKFSVGNSLSKPRASLPSVAFNTIKQHISKTLPGRRSSQAMTEGLNGKIANGDLRRKKLPSDDLTMHDTIHEDISHDSALSSRAPSETEDVFGKHYVGDLDNNRVITSFREFKERHHSVDSDNDEQNKLMKILQDPRRRLSETAAIDRDRSRYRMVGFEDAVIGKFTQPKTKESVSSSDSQTSIKVIPAIKQDPSYGNFEFMDIDSASASGHDCDTDYNNPDSEKSKFDHHYNDSESAVIECETITVNPAGKLHTAECRTDADNHLSTLTQCTTNVPNITILDEHNDTEIKLEISEDEMQIEKMKPTSQNK